MHSLFIDAWISTSNFWQKEVSFWIILETLSFIHFVESIKLLPIIVILIVSLNFLCKICLSKAFIYYDLSQEDTWNVHVILFFEKNIIIFWEYKLWQCEGGKASV